MRSYEILAASATLLSAQALLVFGNEADKAIHYYQPKEIKPDVAAGGLQKLIDRGVLRIEKSAKNSPENIYGGDFLNSQGNRRRVLQEKHAKGETTVETRSTGHRGHHGGTRAGAKQRQSDSGSSAPE